MVQGVSASSSTNVEATRCGHRTIGPELGMSGWSRQSICLCWLYSLEGEVIKVVLYYINVVLNYIINRNLSLAPHIGE